MCDQCNGLYGNTCRPGDHVLVEPGCKRPGGIGKVVSVSGHWVSVEIGGSTHDVLFPWVRKVKSPAS